MSSQISGEGPSGLEHTSIASLSRQQVVEAYSVWTELSVSEIRCLEYALTPNADVLDLGCGAGRHASWLADQFSSYIGIDASKPMVEVAQKKHPKLNFLVADILEYEAADASVDIILLMGNVLDFLHPEERRSVMLEKCYRWLRPGGFVVGSSHLTRPSEKRGFYTEDYHGAELHQFRSSASEMVAEVENFGLEISLLTRDYRKRPADWAYWVATRPSEECI